MAKITATKSTPPPEAVQREIREWLERARHGEQGKPDRLIRGLCVEAGEERWEIGVVDAYVESDETKIYLSLPKPPSHPKGDDPLTEYSFSPATVWLLEAHVAGGGELLVEGNKNGAYYYPIIRIDGQDFRVDRLIANAGPHQLAKQVPGNDHHDHTPGNIRLTSESAAVRQHGRPNVRSVRGQPAMTPLRHRSSSGGPASYFPPPIATKRPSGKSTPCWIVCTL